MKSQMIIVLAFLATTAFGQFELSQLSNEILKNDSLIFEEAFNKCNFSSITALISDDFEFYHDQHGITYGKDHFITSIRENICSLPYRPRRELVEGSWSVFPLSANNKIYGAIQLGKHRFYANEEGREEYFTSIADFSHLWILEGDKFRLKRVLSYNHQSEEIATETENPWQYENVIQWLQENKVPCLGLGLINNGKLGEVSIYGELVKGNQAPLHTLFNVASLTKPIVSMTVLKLADAGKWDLDEPLFHYWIDPDVKDDPNHKLLTTRHVLKHETGFVNWRSWHETQKLTFDFVPGTGFNYSGEGFEYLRRALENKFNSSLETIVAETIFTPLEMDDTNFKWGPSIDEGRFAQWHDGNGENTYKDHVINEVNAADNLLTTIEDYGKFAEWVINGAGLSEELYADMVSTHEVNGKNTNMGLGWEVHSGLGEQNEFALIHSGADRGVHCVTILFPNSKQGLIIMTNGDNGHRLYQKCVTTKLRLGVELWERGK